MKYRSKILLFLIIYSSINIYAAPFFGGFYHTDEVFDKSKFTTSNSISFFLENKFNDNIKLYSRFTGGLIYNANYSVINSGLGSTINDFTFIPNIDLLYFEFKTAKDINAQVDYGTGFVNFNLFVFRLGRVNVVEALGYNMNMKGDGFDTFFTLKNFKFQMFAVTNGLDYRPFFDLRNGASSPVFTRWDTKRMPVLTNYNISGNVNGFVGDITTNDYNYFFDHDYGDSYIKNDYDTNDKSRLNNLRYAAVIAGRIFSGISFQAFQVYNQNISFNILANVDLIPEDFVVTYPTRVNDVTNTFGGKYTSFYFNISASGKIYGGLYYDFEVVYETGYNATYNDKGVKITYQNALINSFSLYSKFAYFFSNAVKPVINFEFMYAHGDEDVLWTDGTVVNRAGQDNNYKSPANFSVGYVLNPGFSNIIVFSLSNSIKPFNSLKNKLLSRILMENEVLLLLRPVVKGVSFLPEKLIYQKGHALESSTDKVFLGFEINTGISWEIYSDITLKIQGGVLIPNYYIYDGSDVYWKAGLTANFSF